jgi:enterobacteria phage integrase
MRHDKYRKLRQTTKAGYSSRLEKLRTEHGHRTVGGLTEERIETILRAYDDRPGQRLAMLKMLRVLITFAIKLKWLTYDPSKGIKRPKSGEIRSWTEEEILAFEERWPIGTKRRLAFTLMLYTGQRRSDVHRMTWADISSAGRITVVQQKTGAKLSIRLHHNLQEVLKIAARDHITILNTEYGKPFTVDGFSGWFRSAIGAAGLPLDCQPHGLRKTAGRYLAEAGCTTKQIQAILGHKSLVEIERYTRDAEQERLADDAIGKLEARKRNESSPHLFPSPKKIQGITT